MADQKASPESRKGSGIRSLARGLRVLRAVRALGRSTLHDIHRATGLPKPTLFRILTTLEQEGYVWRGMGDDLYRLSSRVLDLKEPISVSDIVAEFAAPFMDQLSAGAGWPSDIAVYQDGGMTIGETTRRRTPLIINRLATAPRVHMLMSSLGRAYLAFCREEEQRDILRLLQQSSDPYNRRSHDEAYVRDLVTEVREQGYALRQPGYSVTRPDEDEFIVQLHSIAVPVRTDDRLYGCLSLVWIAEAASETDIIRAHLARLKTTAKNIAAELGTNALAAVEPTSIRQS